MTTGMLVVSKPHGGRPLALLVLYIDMRWLDLARRSCTERAQIYRAMRALLPFFQRAGLASGPGSELAPTCAVRFDLGEFALQALAP